MDWEVVAPMIVAIVFILTVGGVMVLRPIAKRLGTLLEVMAQRKGALADDEEAPRLREVVESMSRRLALMEERQDFTERLLERESGAPADEPPPK